MLANHQVDSVERHEDFPRHGNSGELHLQRHSGAEAERPGRRVAFRSKMESPLYELRREIPWFPANRAEFSVARELAGSREDFTLKMLPDLRPRPSSAA